MHMTKDDLINLLTTGEHADLPGDTPLSDAFLGLYDAETTWSGEAYMTEEERAATGRPDDYNEAPESAVPAIVLRPTN